MNIFQPASVIKQLKERWENKDNIFDIILDEKEIKTKLDKAGVDNYNIGEISYYAKVKYISEEYDEAYTEYRVQEILRK